jgi:hypothetical protein
MIQTTRDFRSDLGWSILWRDEDADRWGWFIPKISGFFKRKGPPGGFGECRLLMEERTLSIRSLQPLTQAV